jgi:molecular chaperone HtpG
VEVFSKSFKDDAPAVRWECDGSPEYMLEETEKADRGTDIVLHINEESAEFLDAERLRGILNRFCRFLPVPIYFRHKEEDKEARRLTIPSPPGKRNRPT